MWKLKWLMCVIRQRERERERGDGGAQAARKKDKERRFLQEREREKCHVLILLITPFFVWRSIKGSPRWNLWNDFTTPEGCRSGLGDDISLNENKLASILLLFFLFFLSFYGAGEPSARWSWWKRTTPLSSLTLESGGRWRSRGAHITPNYITRTNDDQPR